MTNIASTELQASPPSAAWLGIFALVYDPFLWLGEIVGMRRQQHAWLCDADRLSGAAVSRRRTPFGTVSHHFRELTRVDLR
jgi:hypothetical protein